MLNKQSWSLYHTKTNLDSTAEPHLRRMGRAIEMGLPGMMRNTARRIAAVVVDSITTRVSAVMVGAG